MAIARSPFIIIENFLSAKQCEYFVDKIAVGVPDTDQSGYPLRMLRFDEELQEVLFERVQPLIPVLEKYYDFEYLGTEEILMEWYPENHKGSDPQCENSSYLRQKWVRTRTRDITGIIFFSESQDKPPFDTDYEVYGGKLEFPQHGFGFNPQRGTIIFFPSGPHFINNTAAILAGELYQAKVQIAAKKPYLYDPTKFPGNYQDWFKDQL